MQQNARRGRLSLVGDAPVCTGGLNESLVQRLLSARPAVARDITDVAKDL